jgi:LAO/AO transport system kinase
MELVDAILINKADGDNEKKANISKSDYENALHYLQPATKGWKPKVFTGSALTGKGISELWNTIKEFEKITKQSGIFEQRRKEQLVQWVHRMVEDWIIDEFYSNEKVKKMIKSIEEEIAEGRITPTLAAEKLLKIFKA